MKSANQRKAAPPRLLTNGAQGKSTQDDIAHCAYFPWEQHGCRQSYEAEHWLQAEAQLRQSQNHRGVWA